jgi:hypothetical protein
VWVGLSDVLVELSPKFQVHAVGLPVEVSVNVTVWPVVGALGEKVKAAVGFEDVVDWEDDPPPQPASTKQPSARNRNDRVFIGISSVRARVIE